MKQAARYPADDPPIWAGGPTLETYVETRLNLLNERLYTSHEALKELLQAAQAASDTRYQQRFEAQSDALAAAFLSQQTAMQTAFIVAEKAVQSALAAADRAVSKAELASDKRFESLNELRQMLNDMVANLMPRVEAVQRFEGITEKFDATAKIAAQLENRINLMQGEKTGTKEAKDNTFALVAVAIAVAGTVASIALHFIP